MYARVSNGQVIAVMGSLPECTDNISGFNLLAPADLLSHGYYPLTDTQPAFNPDTQKLSAPTYSVGVSSVTTSYTVLSLTAAEMQANLQAAQAAQIAQINNAAQSALLVLVSSYPAEEVATWPNQYSEAQAYTANPSAPTPTLSAIATGAGLTVAQVSGMVLQKAANFTAASGAIIGRRKLLTAQILAATLPSQVKAIVW